MNPSDPYSPLPSPQGFARTREALGLALSRALREGMSRMAGDLERRADSQADLQERRALLQAAELLSQEALVRSARVPEELARRALRYLERSRTHPDGLALVEHEALEIQILAGTLAAAIRSEGGSAYERFAGRVRRLVAGEWHEDDINPLGATVIAASVATALSGVARTGGARLALRQVVAARLARPISALIASADAQLEAAGVAPAVVPAMPAAPAGVIASAPAVVDVPPPASPATEPGSGSGSAPRGSAPRGDNEPAATTSPEIEDPSGAIGMAAASRDAARVGQAPLSMLPAPQVPAAGARLLASVSATAPDPIAFATASGLAPYTRDARAAYFAQARKGLRDSGASAGEIGVVDVVAAMFDYVVDDVRVPETVKPLIWRLQHPSLSLALLDAGYLGEEPRSLRRLIENVGAIAVAFADELGRDGDLFRRLDTVVRTVEVVAGALKSRSSAIARQVEREYLRAASEMGRLVEQVTSERLALESPARRPNRRNYAHRPSLERERIVTEKIRSLIDSRLQGVDLPESVRDFLEKVWLRHLRSAALRSGEDSTEFAVALQVVDDLVWSLDMREARSRRELAERIPPLIRLIGQGVSAIGASDDEYRAFFDELFLIHLRRIQRDGRRSLPGEAPPG